MSKIQIFESTDFGTVRTVLIDKEPYFVGKDVCEAFDDKNHNRSLGRIDEEDTRTLRAAVRNAAAKGKS